MRTISSNTKANRIIGFILRYNLFCFYFSYNNSSAAKTVYEFHFMHLIYFFDNWKYTVTLMSFSLIPGIPVANVLFAIVVVSFDLTRVFSSAEAIAILTICCNGSPLDVSGEKICLAYFSSLNVSIQELKL